MGRCMLHGMCHMQDLAMSTVRPGIMILLHSGYLLYDYLDAPHDWGRGGGGQYIEGTKI